MFCKVCSLNTVEESKYGKRFKLCISCANEKKKRASEVCKKTCLKKYGVDNPSKTKEAIEKIRNKKLSLTREQINKINEKRNKTNKEIYGVENQFQRVKHIKNKFKEKYGVEGPMDLEEFRKKIEKTNLNRYGFKATSQHPLVRKKQEETNILRYGARSALSNKKVREKGYKTLAKKIKNGELNRKEFDFGSLLNINFKKISPQHPYGEWHLDYYLPDQNVYIQFDGEYWHGYTKNKEQLEKTAQGKGILETMERDKLQNEQIKNLIRVRESFYDKATEQELIDYIKKEINRINGNGCNILSPTVTDSFGAN